MLNLGFGVPVRALELRLPAGSYERTWPLIAHDVLAGNNVAPDPQVRFVDGSLEARIEPVPANA
jgi:hypothetical protein